MGDDRGVELLRRAQSRRERGGDLRRRRQDHAVAALEINAVVFEFEPRRVLAREIERRQTALETDRGAASA